MTEKRHLQKIKANRKYRHSDKGTELHKKWDTSLKGIAWQYSNRRRASLLRTSARRRSEKKGIPFNITIDFVEEKLNIGICEVTGMSLKLSPNQTKKMHPFSPSLDQKIPGNGYTPENAQIVCWWYNRLKGDLTDEETIQLIKQIQQIKFTGKICQA